MARLNSGYAIHPEETLADNFALLVTRRLGRELDVPKPEILDGLERALGARFAPY